MKLNKIRSMRVGKIDLNRIWILRYMQTCIGKREKTKRSKKPHKNRNFKIVIPIAIKVRKPYSEERKLYKEILKEIRLEEGSYIIGDRLYGIDNHLAKLLI